MSFTCFHQSLRWGLSPYECHRLAALTPNSICNSSIYVKSLKLFSESLHESHPHVLKIMILVRPYNYVNLVNI